MNVNWKLNIRNLKEWEQIEIVLRRHWIVYVMLWVYFIVMFIISLVLTWMLAFQLWAFLLVVIFWMNFALFLYVQWLNHELDLFVVTNIRVIGIEQISFLNRTVSECNLRQVQEVNSSTRWFFSNVLDYGTVNVQTAGNSTNFIMRFCPRPLEAARRMLNTVEKYRRRREKEAIEEGMNSVVKEDNWKTWK